MEALSIMSPLMNPSIFCLIEMLIYLDFAVLQRELLRMTIFSISNKDFASATVLLSQNFFLVPAVLYQSFLCKILQVS